MLFIKDMSATSLTQYQQMQSTISSTFSSIQYEIRDFSRNVALVKEIYDVDKLETLFKDGTIEYPLKDNPVENGSRGAHIDFK